jgi:CheY-like chemotaxis protein
MNFRILLVEDAEADVYLVRESLGLCGLHVDLSVMDDGEKAVDFIEEADRDEDAVLPHLMLLDLNLPKKSGGQVLERLRKSQRMSELPVIILTSSDSPRDKATAAQLRATDYFRKPSNLDDFMRLGGVVRELLTNTGPRLVR